MNSPETGPAQPERKHLLSAEAVPVSTATSKDRDLTRHKGEGNGVRVHALYFVAVSLVALVLMIVGIAVVTSQMM